METPHHIAIIMDGNGRWAHERGLPRTLGHRAGVEALKKIVAYANKLPLKYLTLFAFSSENWQRPASEVQQLLDLLEFFIKADLQELHKENIHVKVIGDRETLSPHVKELIAQAEDLTKNNQGLCLTVAFNYGSQNEIIRAIKKMAKEARDKAQFIHDITIERLGHYLDTKSLPNPDLIIRTGGELRLSNFLLWQSAYSELYFCKKYWPDFSQQDLEEAILAYGQRERRFGALSCSSS